MAQQRVLKNRTCLEPCLRQFIALLEQLANSDSAEKRPYLETQSLYGTLNDNDAYIPFPRTCGAKFCSVSTLVCFGRNINTRKTTSKSENLTPRALSALGSIMAQRSNSSMSISAYYYPKQKIKLKHGTAKAPFKALAHIYNASGLFHLNQELGDKYSLTGDSVSVCKYNAEAARSVGRMDLVQAWQLAALVANPDTQDRDLEFSKHPLFSGLMQSL